MSRPSHCEWCPFPDCDSCAYKGHEGDVTTDPAVAADASLTREAA